MKKNVILLTLTALFSLTGCGGTNTQPTSNSEQGEQQNKKLESIAIKTQPTITTYTEGETFNPAGMVVEALYDDGSTQIITNYSIPNQKLTTSMTYIVVSFGGKTVNVPITVHAKETAKERFVRAKTKTYENEVYEYTYNIEAKIKFVGAIDFSPAKFKGTVQYDASAPTTQYMHKKEASGILLFDYTTYTYNNGTEMITLNADENKKFSIVNSETVPTNYEFETNSVGFILKKLADNDNLSVTQDGDKYNIALKTSFKNDFLKILNMIDSQKILECLSDLTEDKWGIGFGADCYAKLDEFNDHVTDFHFGVGVNVKDVVEIELNFDQHFNKIGKDVKITLPTFENTFITENDISAQLDSLSTAMQNSKDSYYNYNLKTEVDHGVSKGNPLGFGVNSHSRGYAERTTLDDKIYFHNGLEFDSDYKNKDQYGDQVDDYKYTRAKVNDGNDTVYDVIDGVLKNTYIEREFYDNDEIDDYYMLFDVNWMNASEVKLLRKTNDDSKEIYDLGVSTIAIRNTLEKFNKYIRVDSDEELWIDVYDIKDGFEPKKSKVQFVLSDGKIENIEIDFKGFYVDKKTEKQIQFELEYSLEFDYKQKAYSIPTNEKDIETPNFNVIL